MTVQKLNQKREAVLSNLRAAQHKSSSLPDQAKALIRKTNEILGIVEDVPEKSTTVNVHEYLYSYKQVFDNKKVIFRLQSFPVLLKCNSFTSQLNSFFKVQLTCKHLDEENKDLTFKPTIPPSSCYIVQKLKEKEADTNYLNNRDSSSSSSSLPMEKQRFSKLAWGSCLDDKQSLPYKRYAYTLYITN